MLNVRHEGNRAIIDIREIISQGHHPKGEIFKYVKEASTGTLIEIHLPFKAQPLIAGLSSFGLNVVVNELAPDHFLVRTIKLGDF